MSMLQSTKIIIHKHLLYICNGKFKKLTMWIKIKRTTLPNNMPLIVFLSLDYE